MKNKHAFEHGDDHWTVTRPGPTSARLDGPEDRDWLPDATQEILRLATRVDDLEGILADQGRVFFLHGPSENHEEQAVRAMRAHGAREARIQELEAENSAVDESREIIGELSAALATVAGESLTPCRDVDGRCPGHLGPNARKIFTEALNRWFAMEEELRVLREWEMAEMAFDAAALRNRWPSMSPEFIQANAARLAALAALVAYREKQPTNKEEKG